MKRAFAIVGALVVGVSGAAAAERPFTLWNQTGETAVGLGVRRTADMPFQMVPLQNGSIENGGGYSLGFPEEEQCIMDFQLVFADDTYLAQEIDTCQGEGIMSLQ